MNATLGGNQGGKRQQAGGRVFSLEGGETETSLPPYQVTFLLNIFMLMFYSIRVPRILL